MVETVQLEFPFKGWWLARNSPARKIPSHGSQQLGTTYAIDFIGLSEERRKAPFTWQSAVGLEDPAKFPSFGRELLSPVRGEVVQAWDDIPDHQARRSQFRLLPYVLGQQGRLRDGGVRAITGNAVAIRCDRSGRYVALCHLKQDSKTVAAGDRVEVGDLIGACGNSGNSTQPHLHLQVTDSLDWERCRGLPMSFRSPDGDAWLPNEEEIFFVP